MPRNRKGSTDAHALRLIAEGRILADPATGVILVDGIPRGISDKRSGYQRIYCAGVVMQAHRVVWLACCGPIPEGLVINHRDGNRRNNRLENLEAITHTQNLLHGFRSPNYRGTYPDEQPVAIVHEDQREDIEWMMEHPHGSDPRQVHRIA